MKKQCQKKLKKSYILYASVFFVMFVLAFQNIIEKYINFASYIDELFGLIGVGLAIIFCDIFISKISRKDYFLLFFFLTMYFISGFIGSSIYKYQALGPVMKDAYTNIKFYLTLFAGIIIGDLIDVGMLRKPIITCAKILTIYYTFLFVVDRLFSIWDGQVRYGIRSAVLGYQHPTYLTGSLVFLLAIFAMFYENKNLVYITCDLVILLFTFRAKAIVATFIYMLLLVIIIFLKKEIKIKHVFVFIALAIGLAWKNIYFYFVQLSDCSARSIMTKTSFKVMKDYFPFGTGYATYASHEAAVNYSPVYILYGFLENYELTLLDGGEHSFFDDTFWPIIMGQTGFFGLLCYISLLLVIIKICSDTKYKNINIYFSVIFVMAYLLIATTAEPAFNNSIAIPLGLVLGLCLGFADKMKKVGIYNE